VITYPDLMKTQKAATASASSPEIAAGGGLTDRYIDATT
jgi:hypothetical protein